MNYIMVSFSDHYNSIFIDRVLYKNAKSWQFHGILIIPFQISLCSPLMKKLFFQPKNVKINYPFTGDS